MTSITIDLDPDAPLSREEERQILFWCEVENMKRWFDCQHRVCRELALACVRGHLHG